METPKTHKTVAVSEQTRIQLNELRGVYSVDEYLKNVLLYLKLYRIDPMRRDISPNQDVHNHYNDVMKRIEDVIKIIRSFEKGMKELLGPVEKGEAASPASESSRKTIRQMQDVIDKLREELANNGTEKSKERLMSMYQMITDFIEKNTDADGSLFVGRVRANQFRASLKEVLNG